MSNMSTLHALVFYATPEHECSYLKDQSATTLFVDPRATINKETYTQLTQLGFRRSGNHYYKPSCAGCRACVPVRMPTQLFKPQRSHRRLLKKHQETTTTIRQPEFREEHYAVYEKYINFKHADGDMHPPSKDQYLSFLVDSPRTTQFVEFWHKGCLMGIAVVDALSNGLSAIYTFYDPEFSHLSPGKYAVLWEIEQTHLNQLPYLYLGYWIKECPKMAYKASFRPLEMLVNGRWLLVN